jgi:hypothetical protein
VNEAPVLQKVSALDSAGDGRFPSVEKAVEQDPLEEVKRRMGGALASGSSLVEIVRNVKNNVLGLETENAEALFSFHCA